MDHRKLLTGLNREKEYFVGIDSDGCVFDTMEVKQKEFFIPNGIKFFNLFAISKEVRQTWEFVNLYSVSRGINRFPALVKVIELLETRKDIAGRNVEYPEISSLREWINKESRLGNETLSDYINSNPDPNLLKVLEWSLAVNHDIGKWLKGVSPFPYVQEALEKISSLADAIVVSQTPVEALEREWNEHDISSYVKLIAGQEFGTKTEHLKYASGGKYPAENVLMIGDAPGDLRAAEANGVCFYPVIPGKESESWKRLYNESFDMFLANNYRGEYEDILVQRFKEALPAKPTWEEI